MPRKGEFAERVEYVCPECGTSTFRLPSQTRGGYCSRTCQSRAAGNRRKEKAFGYDVDPEKGCWVWRTQLSRRYPKIRVNGVSRSVHVFFWEQRHGPVPQGGHVHHTCETKQCCNPDHLELLTPTEHMRKHPKKLTEDQAKVIRDSTARTSVLARAFGISPASICDIRQGRTWKDVA